MPFAKFPHLAALAIAWASTPVAADQAFEVNHQLREVDESCALEDYCVYMVSLRRTAAGMDCIYRSRTGYIVLPDGDWREIEIDHGVGPDFGAVWADMRLVSGGFRIPDTDAWRGYQVGSFVIRVTMEGCFGKDVHHADINLGPVEIFRGELPFPN